MIIYIKRHTAPVYYKKTFFVEFFFSYFISGKNFFFISRLPGMFSNTDHLNKKNILDIESLNMCE